MLNPLDQLPKKVRIVSMVLHDGHIYVATEYEVYKYKDCKWETILNVKDLK